MDADSPWKEVCEKKLPLVFALLYPLVYEQLDWSHDYEPLDQELRKFSPASLAGGRIADRLIKAWDQSGDERYFHLEVQGKKQRNFRRRVHICNLRAEERFNAHIVSMAILTDKNLTWRPSRYVSGLFEVPQTTEEGKRKRKRYWDERTLRFLTVKLIDFRGREAELEALDNPMGLFVVAHLEAMRTRKNHKAREVVKSRLLRNLRARKMEAEDARLWMGYLDWFLQLPPERESALWLELEGLEKEDHMPFLSYPERRGLEQGIEKGIEKGMLQGIERTVRVYLKTRFGDEALSWLSSRVKLCDETQLNELYERLFKADTIEKVRALLVPDGNGTAPPTA